MKLNFKKGAAGVLVATVAFFALSAESCNTTSEMDQRTAAQAAKKAKVDSLEITNLKRKIALEENASRVGYVYVFAPGDRIPVGYYVIKGKVSSSGSQLTPENDIVWTGSTSGHVVTDGPQDDGTYGSGDPGVFFFLADGTFVETQLTPLYSTQPLAIDVPNLGGK